MGVRKVGWFRVSGGRFIRGVCEWEFAFAKVKYIWPNKVKYAWLYMCRFRAIKAKYIWQKRSNIFEDLPRFKYIWRVFLCVQRERLLPQKSGTITKGKRRQDSVSPNYISRWGCAQSLSLLFLHCLSFVVSFVIAVFKQGPPLEKGEKGKKLCA